MMSAEWNDHPFSFRKVTLSPRRLRAKYTPRTNLRFVLRVFRPCRGLPYQTPAAYDTGLSPLPQRQPQPCCKKGRTLTTENGDDVCRDTVLSRCQSCPMSKGEYRISRVMQGRKISMPPTAPLIVNFGVTLQEKASRSFSAAAPVSYTHLDVYKRQRRTLPDPSTSS